MKINRIILVGLLLGLLAVFVTTCDRDCPSCPEPDGGEHLFYVYCWGDTPQIKTFSVEQGQFIDSIFMPDMDIKQMEVVGRDKYLFLGAVNGIRVIDLETRETVYNAEGFGGIAAVSPDGKYYVTYNLDLRQYQLHRFADKKLIFADSIASTSGRFTPDSKCYYYVRDTNVISVYDIAGDSIIQSAPLTLNDYPIHIGEIWQSLDGQKHFIFFTYGHSILLGAVNSGEDSVRVFRVVTRTGGYDGSMSPDGEHFYFINNPLMDHELPGDTVYIYDVESEQLANVISTLDGPFEPEHMAVSYDGTYLALTPYAMGNGHIFDILLYYLPGPGKMGFFTMGGSFTDARIPQLVCTRQPGSN